MSYSTTHKGIHIEYIEQPDGSVDLKIQPEFTLPWVTPAKIGVVIVSKEWTEHKDIPC